LNGLDLLEVRPPFSLFLPASLILHPQPIHFPDIIDTSIFNGCVRFPVVIVEGDRGLAACTPL
jgi:hypothetical protein